MNAREVEEGSAAVKQRGRCVFQDGGCLDAVMGGGPIAGDMGYL